MANKYDEDVFNAVKAAGKAIDLTKLGIIDVVNGSWILPENERGWYSIREDTDIVSAVYVDTTQSASYYMINVLVDAGGVWYPPKCCSSNPPKETTCTDGGQTHYCVYVFEADYSNHAWIVRYVPSQVFDHAMSTMPTVDKMDIGTIALYSVAGIAAGAVILKLTKVI